MIQIKQRNASGRKVSASHPHQVNGAAAGEHGDLFSNQMSKTRCLLFVLVKMNKKTRRRKKKKINMNR